jgi:hypothetical protein
VVAIETSFRVRFLARRAVAPALRTKIMTGAVVFSPMGLPPFLDKPPVDDPRSGGFFMTSFQNISSPDGAFGARLLLKSRA